MTTVSKNESIIKDFDELKAMYGAPNICISDDVLEMERTYAGGDVFAVPLKDNRHICVALETLPREFCEDDNYMYAIYVVSNSEELFALSKLIEPYQNKDEVVKAIEDLKARDNYDYYEVVIRGEVDGVISVKCKCADEADALYQAAMHLENTLYGDGDEACYGRNFVYSERLHQDFRFNFVSDLYLTENSNSMYSVSTGMPGVDIEIRIEAASCNEALTNAIQCLKNCMYDDWFFASLEEDGYNEEEIIKDRNLICSEYTDIYLKVVSVSRI